MTDKQRNTIKELRNINKGYSEVAQITGLSKESVKAYCQRHSLGGIRSGLIVESDKCRNCGSPLKLTGKGRKKIFCSDSCRHTWDNKHRNRKNYKAYRICLCKNCTSLFQVYSTANRQFCSHDCYISYRFKKAS